MRKILTFVLCITFLVFFSSCGGTDGAGDLDARIMSVFRLDGDSVRVSNLAGTQTDARMNMGLHTGYAVSTGLRSFCYIRLDTDSIVKMDVSTDISVGQLTDSLLRINIDSGQVLVNVQNQAPGHELEAIIGNTVISVRGTLFVAGVYAGGEAIIIVLDGSVYVNGVLLEAGNTMRVFDGARMNYSITPTEIGELDGFQLDAIIDNQARLIAAGVISRSDLDEVARLAGGVGADGGQIAAVEEIAPSDVTVDEVLVVSVGDIIQFGNYDWRVLDVQDDRALIITDWVIDQRRYHHTQEAVTWETSDIRRWLNSEFFASFSPTDQARIAQSYVINKNNPWDFTGGGFWANTPGGNNTWDGIFLLSIDEVLQHFGDSGLMARGAAMGWGERSAGVYQGLSAGGIIDQYSNARIAHDLAGSASSWWLRSPGGRPASAARVRYDGALILGGYFVDRSDNGIRPALWLYL